MCDKLLKVYILRLKNNIPETKVSKFKACKYSLNSMQLSNDSTNPKLDSSHGLELSTEEESLFVCTVYEVKVKAWSIILRAFIKINFCMTEGVRVTKRQKI